MAEHAIDCFGDDEADVEHCANGEGAAEVGRRMMVVAVMPVPVPVVTVIVLAMVVTVSMIVVMLTRCPMIMVGVGRVAVIVRAVVVLVRMIVHIFNQGSLRTLPYQQTTPTSQAKPPECIASSPPASRG
jgi:hypothetical protein